MSAAGRAFERERASGSKEGYALPLARPLIVVGDVHFAHGSKPETAQALARLVDRSEGAELVLNGDVFNLSLDPVASDPVESIVAMLEPHEGLRASLRAKLS